MVDLDGMFIMHTRWRLRLLRHIHNVMIESYPTDDLSHIKGWVSFLSNRDELLCSLDDVCQYWDNSVELLLAVY
jgi:hypothetical protein